MECKHEEISLAEKTFSNGSIHIEKRCKRCNKHLGYAMSSVEIDKDHVLYFGKHKGKTIKQVMIEDFKYLEWFVNSEPTNNYKEKIAKFLYENIK